MKKTLGIAIIALMSLGIYGCNDTVEGAAEDTKENAEAVERAAEDMAEDVEEATEDVAATTLTARIKSAIVANPITNEDDADINVESDAEMVRLEGYVGSEEAKAEAGEMAQAVLDETNASQTLENNLEVR